MTPTLDLFGMFCVPLRVVCSPGGGPKGGGAEREREREREREGLWGSCPALVEKKAFVWGRARGRHRWSQKHVLASRLFHHHHFAPSPPSRVAQNHCESTARSNCILRRLPLSRHLCHTRNSKKAFPLSLSTNFRLWLFNMFQYSHYYYYYY